jgi:hypothetical protein
MSNMGRKVSNKHKVPRKQWDKWSNDARRMFNAMFHAMRPSMQFVYVHPDATPATRAHWNTTRWNAAWFAADIINRRSKT